MSSLWEAVDLCLLREGIDSLTPRPRDDNNAAEQVDGTGKMAFGDHVTFGAYLDDAEEEGRLTEEEDDEVSIPDEVTLLENIQDVACCQDSDKSDEGEEESYCEEIEGGESCSEREEDASECDTEGNDQGTEDDDDDDDDPSFCRSTPRTGINHGRGDGGQSHHELFLPRGVSPSTESLKYEKDDGESSDEEGDVPSYSCRTYVIGSGRNGRPRMWDGRPACVSSDSSSDGSGSRPSKSARRGAPSGAGGVSFSESVTVHPIFETGAYPPSVVERMYNGREELRANKRRNQLEYAHDLNDWRTATEEDEMQANDDGELTHPASLGAERGGWTTVAAPQRPPCRGRSVVRTYSSALGGYRSDVEVHPGKRMRISCP